MTTKIINKAAAALLASAFILPALVPGQAMAGPGKISSPYVSKGIWEFYNIGTYAFDDEDEWEHEVELEYGITDRVKLSVEAEVKDEEGEDTEFEKVGFGAKMQLTEQGAYFFDYGAKLSYDIGTTAGKADKIGATLYVAKNFDNTKLKTNFKFGHEVGEDRDEELGFDANIGLYRGYGDFDLGLEYFGDFGDLDDSDSLDDQDHSIGPIFIKDWMLSESHTEVEMQLGAYAGLTDGAADATLKYQLELEF